MDREREMIQALIPAVSGLLDKFIPDADTKNKLAHDLATMADNHAQELALAQLEVLKADAACKIDDLIRFTIVQVLGQTDVVSNFEVGDDCIIFDCVSTRRSHQHGRR